MHCDKIPRNIRDNIKINEINHSLISSASNIFDISIISINM